MGIIYYIAISILTIIFGPILYVLYHQKLSKFAQQVNVIPGPKGHPVFGNVLQFIGPRIGRFERVKKIIEPYQHLGIARFWSGPEAFVILFSADAVETLLTSYKNIEKAYIYNYLKPWLGLGLLISTGQRWATRRKLLTPAFHFKILEDFIPVMNEQSVILVNQLEKQTNKPNLHLFKYITLCALDIICASAMGCEVRNQLNEDSEYVQAIHSVSDAIFDRMSYPWLHPDFLFALSNQGRKHATNLKVLHKFTKQVIQEKKAIFKQQSNGTGELDRNSSSSRKRLAFLDLLIESSENGRLLSDKDIQEEVDTFMFEGHDTTSSAIFWTLYHLGLHPEIQDKVFEEIDNIVGKEDDVTSEHLKKLKYLECVCKESLRLYPSVPIISRKATENIKIGNYTIPAGTSCSINSFYLHRDPKHFPNPEKFDPDRFLPEKSKGRHPFAYVPFSAGPRNCIGMKFAMMEDKVVLTHILRRFKVTTMYRGDTIQALNELVLRPSDALTTLLELRE